MNVKTVKLALLAASFLAGTASIASAADLGRYGGRSIKDTPVYSTPAIGWSGFYIGGHAGGSWGNADVSIPEYPATFTVETSGFIGGMHGGYNYQTGRLVLGIEGDWSASNVSGDHRSGGKYSENYGVDENWRASVRGRMGYAVDRALLYATAGVAWADLETLYTYPSAGSSPAKGTTATGFTVGGGMEYAMSQNWALRGEYLYSSFDTERFVHKGASDVSYDTHELRAGITYRFGGYDSLK